MPKPVKRPPPPPPSVNDHDTFVLDNAGLSRAAKVVAEVIATIPNHPDFDKNDAHLLACALLQHAIATLVMFNQPAEIMKELCDQFIAWQLAHPPTRMSSALH